MPPPSLVSVEVPVGRYRKIFVGICVVIGSPRIPIPGVSQSSLPGETNIEENVLLMILMIFMKLVLQCFFQKRSLALQLLLLGPQNAPATLLDATSACSGATEAPAKLLGASAAASRATRRSSDAP